MRSFNTFSYRLFPKHKEISYDFISFICKGLDLFCITMPFHGLLFDSHKYISIPPVAPNSKILTKNFHSAGTSANFLACAADFCIISSASKMSVESLRLAVQTL